MSTTINFPFTILSYNCELYGFEGITTQEHAKSIIELIKKYNPSVALLQNCDRFFLHQSILKGLVDLKYRHFSFLDNVIFTKLPTHNSSRSPLNSNVCGIVSCTLKDSEIFGKNEKGKDIEVCIACCNLDVEPLVKRKQLSSLKSIFESFDNIIIGCDSSMYQYQKDIEIPKEWKDAWYEAGNKDNFYTVNIDTPNFIYVERTDRVWFKGKEIEKMRQTFDLLKNEEGLGFHSPILVKFYRI